MSTRGGLRAIAMLEAAKGTLVVLVGFGLMRLMHKDVGDFAERLVGHFHLNPASGYPRIFLDAIERASEVNFTLLAIAAAAYASIRFAEAYGLWFGRRWAEWLGAVSGAIYIPIELYELARGATAPKLLLLAVNVVIVSYLAGALRRQNSAAR